MKFMKKVLFTMMLFIWGLIVVYAEGDVYEVMVDHSILIKGGAFCESYNDNTISFEVQDGCIVTGIKEGDLSVLKEGAVVGNKPVATGLVIQRIYVDNPLASKIEMADVVHIINNGNYIKEYILKDEEYNISSVKSGFVDDKLYIDMVKDGKDVVVVYDYNYSTGKLTYEVTTKDEALASVVGISAEVLFMSAMEASPGYSEALNLIAEDNNEQMIFLDVIAKYLNVEFEGDETGGTSHIKVEFLVSPNINKDIINAYNSKAEGGDSSQESGMDNPNTGAYVNYIIGIGALSFATIVFKSAKERSKFNKI